MISPSAESSAAWPIYLLIASILSYVTPTPPVSNVSYTCRIVTPTVQMHTVRPRLETSASSSLCPSPHSRKHPSMFYQFVYHTHFSLCVVRCSKECPCGCLILVSMMCRFATESV
ncbi:hypothetical protein B0I72DRAFT_19075 [Yarrowia lipolytica]|uniref:Uncharacterized protein n=1 Tax=Yarrowia lipolytica TaxID=4952 RepID=A0A371C361_YARLL|nr:hypothetical protein BKA91DRAFT_39898 [Yarrowia lipolytica]KAE8169396.1 hypothetical protein BKA90DRAFT_49313 [Yarrowia lipolytica]RDW24430.1 hypothetical protein B0I71DRAFT_2752 [Yarrowia lipolytica]RDW29711.1 hypothetical protein B0I72DRAFT_19075 [Yarrowia lipolytica]RDW36435.1 hypothetical protein B0I73DRAFT_19350 [Yarrowia lipolytica]